MEFDKSKLLISDLDTIDLNNFYFFARSGGEVKRIVENETKQFALGSEILAHPYEQFLYPADCMLEKYYEDLLSQSLEAIDQEAIKLNAIHRSLGQMAARLNKFPKEPTKQQVRVHVTTGKDDFYLVYSPMPTKASYMKAYWSLKSDYEAKILYFKSQRNEFKKLVEDKNKIKCKLNEIKRNKVNKCD